MGLILAVQTACALVFQLFAGALGIDLSPLGGLLGVQWMWFLPALSLAALGSAGSLAGAQTAMGAFLAGAVWLVQLMMNSWLRLNARYVFLFLGVLVPRHPDLAAESMRALRGIDGSPAGFLGAAAPSGTLSLKRRFL